MKSNVRLVSADDDRSNGKRIFFNYNFNPLNVGQIQRPLCEVVIKTSNSVQCTVVILDFSYANSSAASETSAPLHDATS